MASAGVSFHAASVQADEYFNISSANGQAQGAVAGTARDTARNAFEAARLPPRTSVWTLPTPT